MDLFQCWTIPNRPPKRVDCFVILSYTVENTRVPAAPTRAIIKYAYTCWKKFPNAYVIMSTGDNQRLGVPNAPIMASYGHRLGIPRKVLLEECTSLDTYENLLFCRDIIRRNHFRHVTIVTYDLHARRMVAIAKKMGWTDFSYISCGGPGGPAYGIKWFQTITRGNIFLYELLAYFYNVLRGQV